MTDKTMTPAGEASDVYQYRDQNSKLLYEVLRVPVNGGKVFRTRRPDNDATDGWQWNLDGIEPVLWRLPHVIAAARAGHTIHVAGGEGHVVELLKVIPEGDEATCSPGGPGHWRPEFAMFLAGTSCVVYSAANDIGRRHAREVRESLLHVGATVRMVEPPEGELEVDGHTKQINDISDHLAAGRSLVDLLETVPEQQMQRSRTGIDILDLVLRPRKDPEWIIDNTLAMKERLLLIGFEGQGKSTLCRQIATCVAAGLHPFTHKPLTTPRRVLFIDAENQPEQVQDSWASLVGLVARHGFPIEKGMLTVMEEYESMRDLTGPDGSDWLKERVHAYKPELIVMGPLTNLANRDLRDDEPVRRIRNAVDSARAIGNAAFVMEHHAPLKGGADKTRELRPYGSSLFLKWPDYGFGLKPTDTEGVFDWYKNRGPRVRSRWWPERLREGKPNTLEFPWMEAPPEDVKPT